MADRDIIGKVKERRKTSAGGLEFDMPILYHRLDAFFAVYTADYRRVRELVPSDKIRPIRVWPGRATVMMVAFNYHDTSIGPYGEFALAFPSTAPKQGLPAFGAFVHRLPVTTEIAMHAGIELWGYPKFTCDMSFAGTGAGNSVTLTEKGEQILTLKVEKSGLGVNVADALSTLTIRDRNIILTSPGSRALVRVSPNGLAQLTTGSHWMGRELESLQLSRRPILTGDILDATMVLDHGVVLGPA